MTNRKLTKEEKEICEKQLVRHKDLLKEKKEALFYLAKQRDFEKIRREYKKQEREYNNFIIPYNDKVQDKQDENGIKQIEIEIKDSEEHIKILSTQLKDGVEVKPNTLSG
jgi:hypothetical protein